MKSFAIILAIIGISLTLILAFQHRKALSFPPVGVACFDEFLAAAKNGYADPDLNVPLFEFSAVSQFRCASKKGFEQYEITGVDNTGHSFYIHHAGGGMAASGADSYLDHCYKKDGVLVKSVKLVGRDSALQPGSCEFDTNFPPNPESKYDSSKLGNTFF